MPAQRLTRFGLLALSMGLGSLGLCFCGCDSSGGSSPAIAEKKEDLEKRENTIKELYKAKKPGPTRNGR